MLLVDIPDPRVLLFGHGSKDKREYSVIDRGEEWSGERSFGEWRRWMIVRTLIHGSLVFCDHLSTRSVI